jgi:hypothetical protein
MGGKESYWWPNKPYSDDYTAVMHTLRLKIEPTQNQSQPLPEPAMGEAATGGGGGGGEGGDSPPLPLIHQHDAFIRFGFVEWGESRDGGFYTVNGVRINFIGDATPEAGQSDYDAYSTTEGWASHAGAVESFRRYMRLGITANRDWMRAAISRGMLFKRDRENCPMYQARLDCAGLGVDCHARERTNTFVSACRHQISCASSPPRHYSGIKMTDKPILIIVVSPRLHNKGRMRDLAAP